MPTWIRKRDGYLDKNVTTGGYLAFTRTRGQDDVGHGSSVQMATLHFGGIIRDEDGDVVEDMKRALFNFGKLGFLYSGDGIRGSGIGTNVGVIMKGHANVVNTGNYTIHKGERVYFLYPTKRNEIAHKSKMREVEKGKVAILIPERILIEIARKKCGYRFREGTWTRRDRDDAGGRLLLSDMMLAASFVGSAAKQARSGGWLLLDLKM